MKSYLLPTSIPLHDTVQLQNIENEKIDVNNDNVIINNNTKYLSPLRYPGGKSWLMPTIRQWLKYYYNNNQYLTLIEPFLGGGIVSLSALNESLCLRAVSAEIDPDIAAVWKTILGKKNEWLANRIVKFDFDIENINEVLASPTTRVHQTAFKTILRNRISRGGIIAPGAGLLKSGESSRGLSSRWYAQTIANRIRAIVKYKDSLTFKEGDGMRLINEWAYKENSIFFIDPPYPEVGNRLYTYHALNHDKLFKRMSLISAPFLMTYNDVYEVRRLARKYRFECIGIEMKNTHHEQRKELLITKSREWI